VFNARGLLRYKKINANLKAVRLNRSQFEEMEVDVKDILN
jgi:hypothetical protein